MEAKGMMTGGVAEPKQTPSTTEMDTETTTEKTAGTPGVHHWFKADEPEIPGKTVTTTRKIPHPIGLPTTTPAPGFQPPTPLPSAAPTVPGALPTSAPPIPGGGGLPLPPAAPTASAPDNTNMVSVIHPDGTPGLIPAQNLQKALSLGYKQAQ
jgi:hypothetical protein